VIEFNIFRQSRYAADAIARKFKEQMDRNETIEIKPTQNGYIVEYSYRLMRDGKDGDFDYKYMNEKYIYTNWDDVVKYVSEKKLEVPSNK